MSTNLIDKATGELITLASGTRVWIGSKSSHDIAESQGKLPNNCLIAITDDTANGQTPVVMNISNSDVNVDEPFYTDKTNSMEVFKIIADAMFNDIDTSRVLKVYTGHATAYTTDDSGYPDIAVSTYIASSCWGANGHPYIRMRIFSDWGQEYKFQRSQDGSYTLTNATGWKTAYSNSSGITVPNTDGSSLLLTLDGSGSGTKSIIGASQVAIITDNYMGRRISNRIVIDNIEDVGCYGESFVRSNAYYTSMRFDVGFNSGTISGTCTIGGWEFSQPKIIKVLYR